MSDKQTNIEQTELRDPTAQQDGELSSAADLVRDINDKTGAVKNPTTPKTPRYTEGTRRVSIPRIVKAMRHCTPAEHKQYAELLLRRIRRDAWVIFRFILLFGLIFAALYPFIYMTLSSLKPQAEINDPSALILPRSVRFENFKEVWSAVGYPSALWNTVRISVISSVLSVAACAITGYGFARFEFRGKKAMFAVVLLQILVPPQLISVPLGEMFGEFDVFGLFKAFTGEPLMLLGNEFAMYIPAIFGNGIRAGLLILLFRQFFRTLPRDLEDAAYLEGCAPFKAFVCLILPSSAGTLLTGFLFSLIWYWNEFYVSSLLLPHGQTLALKTIELAAAGHDRSVWAEAGCVMAVLPVVIVYILGHKRFVEGLEHAGLAEKVTAVLP